MSNVSPAARELAKDIQDYLGMQDCTKPIQEMIAKRIQSAVKELVERGKWLLVYAEAADLMSPSFHELKSALAPWEVPEVGPAERKP